MVERPPGAQAERSHAGMRDSRSALPAYDRGWALFLDVDGTLIDIAAHPDAVTVRPELVQVLASLVQSSVPLALVSGRAIGKLDALLAPLRLPAAGQHGAERRDAAGNLHRLQPPPGLAQARTMLESFCQGRDGLLLEDKGVTLALHFRMAPDYAAEVSAIAAEVAARTGLAMHHGKMLCELRPPECDKGQAIAAFMREPPYAGRRPVFLGDDVTDEDGFHVVMTLGGHAIKVGSGESAAPWRLGGVDQVIAWLAEYQTWLAGNR